MSERAEAPVVHRSGLVRVDDVYSVLMLPGEVIYELAKRFRGSEDHMPYVWRLRWRTFADEADASLK